MSGKRAIKKNQANYPVKKSIRIRKEDTAPQPCTCYQRGATGRGQRHTLCRYQHEGA